MVALMVAFVALTVLAGVFIGSLHTLTVAKQRQSATALGTRAMEQMRALPFSAITSGVSINDLAGDPDITGTPARLAPVAEPTIDEVLQTNGSVVAATATLPLCTDLDTPLVPHRCTVTLDRIVYTVASYVSQVPASTPTQYSLTTIVTWASNATGAKTKRIVNRSRAFSPNGTCTPANHPFNTPCQSQYSASAGLSEGGVTLTGLVEGAPIAADFDVISAELSLPRLTTSTAVEQTVTVRGATGAHSAKIVRSGGVEETSGEQALSSAATDPSNSTADQPTAVAVPASPNPLSASSNGWSVTVVPETSGDWRSTSRAAAGTNSECKDSFDVAIDDTEQPCGSSSNVQGSAASMSISPAVMLGRQLDMQLASFGASGTARAFGARFVTPRPTWCPLAGGFGCVAAAAQRTLGTAVLGQLPTEQSGDLLPAGFAGAVRLTGYSGAVSTSSATGAEPPTVDRAGTLDVWNGTAYTSHLLNASAASFPVAAVGTYAGTGGLGTITVTVMGTVEVSAASSSPGCHLTTLCEASTGSIVADLTYDFSVAGTSVAGFRVRTDVGSLLAKTSFVAA